MPRDLCAPADVDYRRPSHRATISSVARGCSAVGSASPCQGEGRGFESRHPLEGAVASTPAVEWPSGEATACKAVHTGSIPVSTSKRDPARLAQRESASLTRKRSLVQSQYRALRFTCGYRLFRGRRDLNMTSQPPLWQRFAPLADVYRARRRRGPRAAKRLRPRPGGAPASGAFVALRGSQRRENIAPYQYLSVNVQSARTRVG